MPYSWITRAQAITALQGRLSNASFWTVAELILYLNEALRVWNALTEQWILPFSFTPTTQNLGTSKQSAWNSLGTLANSPRFRTVTDINLYTEMQYHLLEPPSGGTWTGSPQFSLAGMQFALQKARDEVIQALNCNMGQLAPSNATPNVRRFAIADSVLEPTRMRFLPGAGFGAPVTLTREDRQAFDYFTPDWLQEQGTPQSWGVISEPPLAIDVDIAPAYPGQYDLLALQAGVTFNPPTSSLLNVPDDYAWIVKYKAMADLLGRESEATDRARAAYCEQRYKDGLEIAKVGNYLVDTTLIGVSAVGSVTSLARMDVEKPEWEQDDSESADWGDIVVAGVDFLAPYPVDVPSMSLMLVANMDIPASDGAFVQVSRDVMDVILDYAQHTAMFKSAGMEFTSTKSLLDGFFVAASETNKRIAKLGLFANVLRNVGRAQAIDVPRE